MCLTFGCTIWESFLVRDVMALSVNQVKIRGVKQNEGRTIEVTARGAVLCPGAWANELLEKLE